MQCLQYVFYLLISLQKHRVCVKGHQNNLQTSKIIPRRDRAPRFLNFWIRYWYGLDRLDYNYLQCSNIATGHAQDMCISALHAVNHKVRGHAKTTTFIQYIVLLIYVHSTVNGYFLTVSVCKISKNRWMNKLNKKKKKTKRGQRSVQNTRTSHYKFSEFLFGW